MLAGLESQIEYWIDLTVGWLEQGVPLDEEIVEALSREYEIFSHRPAQEPRRHADPARHVCEGQLWSLARLRPRSVSDTEYVGCTVNKTTATAGSSSIGLFFDFETDNFGPEVIFSLRPRRQR